MGEQYFKNNPNSTSQRQRITAHVANMDLSLWTDNGVFSKERMDYGSKVLVETFMEHYSDVKDAIIELGSGYGPVVIALAKKYAQSQVLGIELNERAYDLAVDNAQLNHVTNAQFVCEDVLVWTGERARYIVTNPPIRAGKKTIQAFIEQADRHLVSQGECWVVIQKKQGAPSMQQHMENVFGNVELVARDKGYWILRSVKV